MVAAACLTAHSPAPYIFQTRISFMFVNWMYIYYHVWIYIYKGKNKESTNAQMGIVGAHCSTSSLFDRAPSSSLLLSQRKDKTLEPTNTNKKKRQFAIWPNVQMEGRCCCFSVQVSRPILHSDRWKTRLVFVHTPEISSSHFRLHLMIGNMKVRPFKAYVWIVIPGLCYHCNVQCLGWNIIMILYLLSWILIIC